MYKKGSERRKKEKLEEKGREARYRRRNNPCLTNEEGKRVNI